MVAVWAVVVAAGSGERLGADQPKAFVRFGDDPLIAASVAALDEHPAITDRKSTRLNSSHVSESRMPSSA